MRGLLRHGISLAACTVVSVLVALPPTALAEGKLVDVKSGSETIQAYLALPATPAKGNPAIVVVQEWWGLTDWVKSIADRLAAQGYVAIAPDLYRGKVATDPELAHELMRGLPDERALRDNHAAAAYLKGRKDLAPQKTGMIGFCMGGRLALLSSLDKGPFVATVVCYGSPETNPDRLKTLRGPVLGIYGADDRGIGPDQTGPFQMSLKKVGRLGGVFTYPGVGHAFLRDPGSEAGKEQVTKAWVEIDKFLAASLKAKS